MATESKTIEQILELKSFLNGMNDDAEYLDDNKKKFNDKLVSLSQDDINSHTDDYLHETLLHVAARQGHVWAAQMLLEAKASVSEQDSMTCQPLHAACENGNPSLVELLLKYKADIQAVDYAGWSPLHWASSNGRTEAVRLLLKSGANALATNDNGDTPFHMAASYNYSDTVEIFLERNTKWRVDVDAPGKWKMTALHRAAWEGHEETIRVLLDQGAGVVIQDIDGWTPLMAATKGQELSGMRILLEKRGYDQANIQDDAGMTPLLVAIEYENLEALDVLLEHWPDENKRNPNVYQRFLLYEGSTTKKGILKMQKSILDALKNGPGTYNEALFWAAAKFERHEIAKKLLLENPDLKTNESSAIELATQQKNPDVLWWLIATSPRTRKITKNIKSALLKANEESRQQPESTTNRRQGGKLVNKSKPHEDNYNAVVPADGNQPSIWRQMIDILEYPQIAQVYEDSAILEPPRLKSEHFNSVGEFRAVIARFYKAKDGSSNISRTRDLRDIVYGRGPTRIMTEAISNINTTVEKRFQNKDNSKSRKLQATYDKNNLSFTYIHLPATNVDWMKDLLLRIMVDEKMENSIREVNSFLKSTWFEIPDRNYRSRFMRPHFSERISIAFTNKGRDGRSPPKRSEEPKETTATNDAQHDTAQDSVPQESNNHEVNSQKANNQETAKGKEQERDAFIPSSALYMPFLSFATQTEDLHNCHQDSNQEADKGRDGPGQKSERLIKAYKGSVIHSSATLDEVYYHFDLNDTEAQKDRKERNRSQVVTRQLVPTKEKSRLPGEPRAEPWPLLRVNQIWIWTIDNKWVISATSHPVDDVEQLWLEGFTEHLNKQIEAKGAHSQPGSTKDMMKAMVNYCIESYERRRFYRDPSHQDSTDDWQIGRSIRQLFSDHINYIGRKETELFSSVQKLENGSNTSKREEKFRKATIEAENLFGEIKDIRDELGIIKSIVNYQKNVQRKLFLGDPTDSGLDAKYIIDDIAEMERLASRIQSAVNSTLSLLQSEMGNFQAEQSVKQGNSMMAFTLITIIFLPLSFLSSLFALDVESFQKAPAWAFGIIFGVSLAFTALAIYALYLNRYVVAIAKSISVYIKKHPKKQHNDIKEQFDRNVENHYGRVGDEEEGLNKPMVTKGQRERTVFGSVFARRRRNHHQSSGV